MSDLINLYLYYDRMAERFWRTDWSRENDYVKYCQFRYLADALLRVIKGEVES